MAGVPFLPEEILELVFSNFKRTDLYGSDQVAKRKTLVSVCQVNKQCCRLAQPMLFATIDISDGYGVVGRLLEAIVHQPRLADLVNVLHIDSWRGFNEDREMGAEEAKYLRDTYHAPPKLLPALDDIRPVLGALAEQLLERAAGHGSDDTSLSLVLVLCQKLTHLALTVPHGYETSWVYKVLSHLACKDTTAMPLLKEITIEHWDTEGSRDAEEISALMTFPSLRTFRGHMVNFGESEIHEQYPRLRMNALREIHFTYSAIDATGLKNLLLNSPCIETLSIEWGDSVIGEVSFRYDEIGEAIRLCHANGSLNNLKSLTLDDRSAQNFAREEMDDDDHIFHELGDLSLLTTLEVLELPQSALVGVDESEDAGREESEYMMPTLTEILPTSLVRLKVNSPEAEGMADLDGQLLALVTDDRFDHLVEITLNREPQPFLSQSDFEDKGWKFSQKVIWSNRETVAMTLSRPGSDTASNV